MAIQTVCGEISEKQLGTTLAHEHILIDLRCVVEEPQTGKDVFYEKLSLSNRYRVYNDPYTLYDNAFIDNVEIAIQELKLYKQAGGTSIVDATLDEIGRDPLQLKHIAEQSGVNIIMGCGHYVDVALPVNVHNATVKELAEEMIQDITIGVRETGIKAGVIGEIGTSEQITPAERKLLTAAGIASAQTGKAVHVHTALYKENGFDVIETLKRQNMATNKIAINHIDVKLREDYILKLLDMGVYVEFDNFGKEFYIFSKGNRDLTERFAYDLERVQLLVKLVEKGYLNQILITNDICLKSMLCAYGGNGYGHILNTVKAMLLNCGLSEQQLQTLLVDNVAEFLK